MELLGGRRQVRGWRMLVVDDGFVFFFFKQKTAYEMCGRDWSSDVCSPLNPGAADPAARFNEYQACKYEFSKSYL